MRKKKIAGLYLILLLCVQFLPCSVYAEENVDEPENLYAQSAVLMDADSGRVLFGKEENVQRAMASTTKIMTCIVVLENVSENEVAEVSAYAASQPKVHLGVREGETYYIKDLLYSLMLESHNDSAVVLAETIAGSVTEFANIMNEKAEELGCSQTHFVTPNGLDGEDDGGVHSTTAKDLATIMKYCIMDSPGKDTFLEITRTKSYSFTDVSGQRSFSCNNHNAFLDMMGGALSGKTGFTADAGYCYVGALEDGGRTFIVALLACGWPNNKGYKWSDTRKLMNYALANYEYREIELALDSYTIEVPDGVQKETLCDKGTTMQVGIERQTDTISYLLGKDEIVDVSVELPNKLKAPVLENRLVGYVYYKLGETIIKCEEIIALEAVEKWTIQTCASYIKSLFLLKSSC